VNADQSQEDQPQRDPGDSRQRRHHTTRGAWTADFADEEIKRDERGTGAEGTQSSESSDFWWHSSSGDGVVRLKPLPAVPPTQPASFLAMLAITRVWLYEVAIVS